MSLFAETLDLTALPADIREAGTPNPDSAHVLPVRVVTSFEHYPHEVCDRCDKPVNEHVWFAATNTGRTRVLRCSNTEGKQ